MKTNFKSLVSNFCLLSASVFSLNSLATESCTINGAELGYEICTTVDTEACESYAVNSNINNNQGGAPLDKNTIWIESSLNLWLAHQDQAGKVFDRVCLRKSTSETNQKCDYMFVTTADDSRLIENPVSAPSNLAYDQLPSISSHECAAWRTTDNSGIVKYENCHQYLVGTTEGPRLADVPETSNSEADFEFDKVVLNETSNTAACIAKNVYDYENNVNTSLKCTKGWVGSGAAANGNVGFGEPVLCDEVEGLQICQLADADITAAGCIDWEVTTTRMVATNSASTLGVSLLLPATLLRYLLRKR